jgi:hypothetical protein
MDLETASDSWKKSLIEGEWSEVKFLSDLWLGVPDKKHMPFLRLYRLLSLVIVVIQLMLLGCVIYENVVVAPFRDLSFQIISARLFVVFALAGNIADCISSDVVGYFSLTSLLKNELDEDATRCGQIVLLLALILQGFCYALGIPALIIGLVRMMQEDISWRDMIIFTLLAVYEWVLLVMVLVASVAVVIIQPDAVSILFNFVGVVVVMQLDDYCLKLIHFKVQKPEKLSSTDDQIALSKLSLAGFVAVITFIYSFLAKT